MPTPTQHFVSKQASGNIAERTEGSDEEEHPVHPLAMGELQPDCMTAARGSPVPLQQSNPRSPLTAPNEKNTPG